MRLLCRRSRLTSTGSRPYDAGTSPENLLYERLRVPARDGSSARDSGREPLRKLEDKSRCFRALRASIWAGTGPTKEFRERSREMRLVALKRWAGMSLEKLFLDRLSRLSESRWPSSEGM